MHLGGLNSCCSAIRYCQLILMAAEQLLPVRYVVFAVLSSTFPSVLWHCRFDYRKAIWSVKSCVSYPQRLFWNKWKKTTLA